MKWGFVREKYDLTSEVGSSNSRQRKGMNWGHALKGLSTLRSMVVGHGFVLSNKGVRFLEKQLLKK